MTFKIKLRFKEQERYNMMKKVSGSAQKHSS